MFRETLQVLVCLSVLISSSVSLHMVRDAYHRPLSGLNPVHNDPDIFNSKHNTGNLFKSLHLNSREQTAIFTLSLSHAFNFV